MPPKPKFSREKIIDTAYEMVRKWGEDILSARNLAAELGCSTAPIFTVFSSVEEVEREVAGKATALYREYLDRGLSQPLPFKGAGLAYIKFAKDEPQLFKLLFMRGDMGEGITNYMPAGDEEPLVRGALKSSHGVEDGAARKIYNHLSVYVHGFATMFAEGRCIFSDVEVEQMVSEVFRALAKGEAVV